MEFSPRKLLRGPGGNIILGVGVALAVPLLWPVVAAAAKPVAKAGIKGYLALAGSVKEMVAEAGEQVSDLVAEAKAERDATAQSKSEPDTTA
jgi:hypothetical protein